MKTLIPPPLQGPYRLDPFHPLSRGVRKMYLMGHQPGGEYLLDLSVYGDRTTKAHLKAAPNEPKWVSHEGRYALSFVGTNSWAEDVNAAHLPTGDSPRTVSYWQWSPNTTGNYQAVTWGTAGDFKGFECGIYNSSLRVDMYYRAAGTEVCFTSSKWEHACVTFDGVTMRFYVNGQFDSATTVNNKYGTQVPLAGNMNTGIVAGNDIGRRATTAGQWFNGYISDPIIWGRALSSWEVSELYESTLDGSPPPCVAPLCYDAFPAIPPAPSGLAALQQAGML